MKPVVQFCEMVSNLEDSLEQGICLSLLTSTYHTGYLSLNSTMIQTNNKSKGQDKWLHFKIWWKLYVRSCCSECCQLQMAKNGKTPNSGVCIYTAKSEDTCSWCKLG
jgi:hypothetical protein